MIFCPFLFKKGNYCITVVVHFSPRPPGSPILSYFVALRQNSCSSASTRMCVVFVSRTLLIWDKKSCNSMQVHKGMCFFNDRDLCCFFFSKSPKKTSTSTSTRSCDAFFLHNVALLNYACCMQFTNFLKKKKQKKKLQLGTICYSKLCNLQNENLKCVR